jgi:hypothetical protein
VYDPGKKMVYMHGGNAGLVATSPACGGEPGGEAGTEGGDAANADAAKEKEKRLDDFWCMLLKR